RPGDVMHGARTAGAALVGAVVAVERAALLAADLPGGLAVRRELERLLQEVAALLRVEGVGANGVESLQRDLAGHLRVVGDQRLVARLDEQELVPEALGIRKQERGVAALGRDTLGAEALLPKGERVLRGDAPGDAVDHAGARGAAPRAGIFEEGDVGARIAPLVAVEEVVDGRVILVDALLDEPQAQDARVEVDVARRVRG